MARQSSSTTRGVGGDQKLSAPCPKYTKVVRNGVVVEMEVIPVGGDGEVPNARPFVKPPRVVETATCGTMVREKKSARRAGADEQFSLPSPKRTKVTRDGVKTISVEPALGTLRKRMAAELDALHALLRKAELLSSGNNERSMAAAEPRSEAPAEASIKTPPAQRTKVSTPAKIVEFESAEDKNEFVDICGGVSPAVPVEKAGESGNSPISSSDFGSSSSSDSDSDSDSGSSSSSDSDSDSESDSDPDETVDVPVPLPQAVLPQENGTSVQPAPEPASEVVQSKEPEKHSKTDLIAKAKIRRQLLEMERAVLPDESIHARDLRRLCIAEYGRPGIMQRLGLFLKADAARPFSKRPRESSTGRVGADRKKLPVPWPKYTKLVRNGAVVEMEIIPVARPLMKRPQVVGTATCGAMVREKKSARRAAAAQEQFPEPSPKRTKTLRRVPFGRGWPRSTEAEEHSKADLIAKAKVRRELLEMERAVLPDERDLKDLSIAEYGRPGTMQRLGLFLKADA
ncbi:hypothetical protein SETIT_1G226900v2 [Setaria italica]|uniref:Uncharacterized protein n=2 Tax=Setaria italica TaxID=4555 RepID=A0A368PNI1_SETIT|nr:hypothetical protein SETIT_1G226900v2 [Setaria italica]